MKFRLVPGPYVYRPLKLADPMQKGFDVFALQTALVGIGREIDADGYFGKLTDAAVQNFQVAQKLTKDGIAGILTQRALAVAILKTKAAPYERLYGSVEHESGWQLGNHTAPYPDSSRDCGVAQRNTRYTPMDKGFDVPDSLRALDEKIRDFHHKYLGWGVEDPRAWNLAQGSWNAPAWTDRLAKDQPLAPDQLSHIAAYIAAVTTYV